MKEVLAEDISVGDLIYLEDNDMIPCDMVVLSTSQVESFQDFLIRLYMKPCMHLVEISIFLLNSMCHYQNYEQSQQKLGTFLEKYFRNKSSKNIFLLKKLVS